MYICTEVYASFERSNVGTMRGSDADRKLDIFLISTDADSKPVNMVMND